MGRIVLMVMMLATLGVSYTACNNGNKSKTEQLSAGEMYTCSMHPEVMGSEAGKCPKCGMTLEKRKMTDEQKKMMESGSYVQPKKE